MSIRPLGIVKDIVEAAGMAVSYAYEDLVFLEQSSFLLQFSDKEQEVLIHTNCEAEEAVVASDISRLQEVARGYGMRFVRGELYALSQEDDESIRIDFNVPG